MPTAEVNFEGCSEQAERSTGDEVGQHNINRVLEYSNNGDQNFRQFSLHLKHHMESKVLVPSVGGENALVSIYFERRTFLGV